MNKEPFIGREEEMQTLLSALEDAEAGNGHIVTISGEPGIGKTRCAEELVLQARERGFTVLWGHCQESIGTPAYWPWVEALTEYVRGCDEKTLSRALGSHVSILADLIPAIREKKTDIPEALPIADHESAQFRLYNAVSEFIRNAASNHVMLIVLEDLNWADTHTLQLMEYLASQIGIASILLVGTYRDVELSRRHPLSATLGELARSRTFMRISLKRLSEPQIRAYLDQLLTQSIGPEKTQEVIERTEGNPFFLRETTRQLKSDPQAKSTAEGIREVIGRRLDQLPEACNELLTLAAIIGRDFSVEKLTCLSEDLDEIDVMNLIADAVRSGLIEEMPPTYGDYRFSHALIQETLLEELSLPRGVQIHANAARALETFYGKTAEAHAAELLYHFTNAQHILGREPLIIYAQCSGEQALLTQAFEEAARCFRTALEALAEAPMDDRKASISFGMGIAVTATEKLNRENRDGYRYVIDAFDYYVTTNQTEKAIDVASTVHAGGTFSGGSDMARMRETALELVESGSIEEARILCFRAAEYGGEDEYLIDEWFSRAGDIARKRGDPNLELLVLARWALRAESPETYQSMIAAAQNVSGYDDPRTRQHFCEIAGFCHAYTIGDTEQALKYFEEANALSAVANTRREASLQPLVRLRRDSGKWDEARRFADTHPEVMNTPVTVGILASIEFETGRYERGEALLSVLIDKAEAEREKPGWNKVALATEIPGLVRRGADRSYLDVAERAAMEVLEMQQLSGRERSWLAGQVSPLFAFASAIRGEAEVTRERYEVVMKLRDDFNGQYQYRGFILRVIGDIEGSLACFRDDEEFNLKAGFTALVAWSRYDMACTLIELGNAESIQKARTVLCNARAGAEKLGMVPLTKLIEEKTEELKLHITGGDEPGAGEAGRALPAGLTEREVEVLQHLVSGKTNQEIARDLYISEKTVHNHLSHIFQKLDVGNRTEAATTAIRLSIGPAQTGEDAASRGDEKL